jgi:hypothetical protein
VSGVWGQARSEVEARKGAPLMGGAHNTFKGCFKGFMCEGGAGAQFPPRGVRK